MKQSCRQIWQEVFADSEEFVNLYFTNRYSDNCTFVSRQGDEIVSCAQCFLYRMTDHSSQPTLKVGYVSGLATLPKYRGQGHARNVMLQLHQWLREQGADYCILIPSGRSAAQWYRKQFGYCYGLRNSKRILTPSMFQALKRQQVGNAEILNAISKELQGRPYCIQHTPEDLTDQWLVCEMSGGGVYSWADSQGETGGYLFLEFHDNTPVVLDWVKISKHADVFYDFLSHLKEFPSQQGMFLPIISDSPMSSLSELSLMLD